MTVFSTNAFKGKHALVTGATGDIGTVTAKTLAEMGANVTITARHEEKLHNLANEIQHELPEVRLFYHAANLGNESEHEGLVNAAEGELGPVSLLVNSAGVTGGGPVGKLEQNELERIMHLNYTSVVLLTQCVYKRMKDQKNGAIVNVASLSGIRGTYGNTAYAASKFALIGFTHSMAVEAIEHGVRVNAVCPGFVNSEMGRNSVERKAMRSKRTASEVLKQTFPSGRMSEPIEVANTIAFLLTDAAENIVGESVKITGGSVLK